MIGAGINTVVSTMEGLISGTDWNGLGSGLANWMNGIVGELDFENLGLALKEEVKEAQKIRKSVYNILRQEQQPHRKQDMER